MSTPVISPFGRMSGLHGLTDISLKKLLSWGEHVRVDHPQIDAQHQAIFDIALEIAEIWQRHDNLAQVSTAADKLAKVLEAHFNFEEQQLSRIGYSELAEHREEHRVMLAELASIRARLSGMGSGTIQSEPGFVVLSFILGVTVGHVSHSDMDYCLLVRQAASGRDT